jgi:hypothetical protein
MITSPVSFDNKCRLVSLLFWAHSHLVAQCPHWSIKARGGCVEQSKSGQWWNGGWQRWGKSEWDGEKTSNIRKDERVSVTLNEKKSGFWVEDEKQCQAPFNPLANGVFVWTETKGAGHAFVSVHESNSPFVYTYGRFGRRGTPLGATGDGILNLLRSEDARGYYQDELYLFGARVFRIDDADPFIVRKYFEKLWANGTPPIKTPKMGDVTRRNGHTVDQYDVTGSNCTTHTVDGIKIAGSKVFQFGATSGGVTIGFNVENDFTIPTSLQRHLIRMSKDTSMVVVEVTGVFKSQYPNTKGIKPVPERASVDGVAANVFSELGKGSPLSGATVGGVLAGRNAGE